VSKKDDYEEELDVHPVYKIVNAALVWLKKTGDDVSTYVEDGKYGPYHHLNPP
jgi:hypothetical protein